MVAGPVFNIVGRVLLSWDFCGILKRKYVETVALYRWQRGGFSGQRNDQLVWSIRFILANLETAVFWRVSPSNAIVTEYWADDYTLLCRRPVQKLFPWCELLCFQILKLRSDMLGNLCDVDQRPDNVSENGVLWRDPKEVLELCYLPGNIRAI